MQTYAYPANIEEDHPGDFVLRFRDIPEALSGGDTLEEAFSQAEDCLAAAAEGYVQFGRDLPAPSTTRLGERLIVLDPIVAARAMLASALREQGLSNVALAQRLQIDEKGVRRILSGKGASLSRTLQALRAAGVNPALAA